MFPLGGVLFPGRLLPLHVFEPRYVRLVSDCLAAEEPEFGVVLIERGSEVGGGDVRSEVGCVARILRVQELGDGRLAMVTGGMRRLRVLQWLDDDPYPQALVEDWPEGPGRDGLGALTDTAVRRTRRSLALAAELGASVEQLDDRLVDDAVSASHILSAVAPLGPADQQRLLAQDGPRERLELLLALLDEVDEVLQFRLAGG